MKRARYLVWLVAAASVLIFSCTRTGSTIKEPNISDIEGTAVRLHGKITVINVWATWCGTCVKEMSALNRLQAKYANDPEVQFIAFSDEDLSKVNMALRRWPFNYTQVVDARGFTRKLKSGIIKTYPQNLVLDEDCKVVFEQTDGSKDIYTSLDEKIQELKSN